MTNENTNTTIAENNDVNLSDFALFLSVMKIKKAYQDVLSIILNDDNLELEQVKVEEVVLKKKENELFV